MGIVDKVMGGLSSHETRKEHNSSLHSGDSKDGVATLADGRPSETIVDDKIGGTHTRNVKDAVTHENVTRHAHHEVTPVVGRERDEVDIHQKVQPVLDQQEKHTHHQHVAPEVHRERGEDISDRDAAKYAQQAQHTNTQNIGEQTHSTSVNAPKVHEHVNKHIVEEIQPVIERQTNQTEHHHTIQNISEHVTHAPKVHDTTVNAPISLSQFQGQGAGALGGSHGPRDALVDDKSHGSHHHSSTDRTL